MTAPRAGMALVASERRQVRLNRRPVFQKQEADRVARQLLNKSFRIREHRFDLLVGPANVERFFRRQNLKFISREGAAPANIGEHFFRVHSREATDGRRNNSAKRQYMLVNRDKVDDIAGYPPIRGGRCFVGREIGWMQNITEQFVRLRREKPKIGIGYPFELGYSREILLTISGE